MWLHSALSPVVLGRLGSRDSCPSAAAPELMPSLSAVPSPGPNSPLPIWRRGQRVMPWRRQARFNVVGQMRRLAAASRRPTPNCVCRAR